MGASKGHRKELQRSSRLEPLTSLNQSLDRQCAEEPRQPQIEYRAIVEAIASFLYIANANYDVEFANRRFIEHLGFDPTGLKCYQTLYDLEQICPWCENDRVLRGETVYQEVLSPKNNRWYATTNTPLRHANGRTSRMALIQDITERKVAEELSRKLAYQDALTGLPNRALFNDRLEQALPRANRSGHMVAVMVLDLDYFKIVNDTLGHPGGDFLLISAGQRLLGLLRKGDTVARLGGDEFAAISLGISRVEDAAKIAQKILNLFRRPFIYKEKEVWITTSIGIALFPKDAKDPESLEKNADKAMYCAKAAGRNNYKFYSDGSYRSILIPLA